MNIYKISCYSSCGSYFQAYLKSITVIAKSSSEAVAHAKQWLVDHKENFIYDESKWEVSLLCSDIKEGVVVEVDESSDY